MPMLLLLSLSISGPGDDSHALLELKGSQSLVICGPVAAYTAIRLFDLDAPSLPELIRSSRCFEKNGLSLVDLSVILQSNGLRYCRFVTLKATDLEDGDLCILEFANHYHTVLRKGNELTNFDYLRSDPVRLDRNAVSTDWFNAVLVGNIYTQGPALAGSLVAASTTLATSPAD